MTILILAAAALGAPTCAGLPNHIDQVFANGARWQACFAEDPSIGIIWTEVTYTAAGGAELLVLGQLNLAEMHISYDDSSSDFFDVAAIGLGGANLTDLTVADCPGGTRISSGGRNVLCRILEDRGLAWKLRTTQATGEQLVLYSDSQLTHYNFLVAVGLSDDGAIELSVGATGELAKYTGNPLFGWPVDVAGTLASSHAHNLWWRLDFDLGGSADDVVEQLQFGTSGSRKRPMTITAIPTETASPFAPDRFRFWRVRDDVLSNLDGHRISYDVVPAAEVIYRGPVATEPWTVADLYVTEDRACEKFIQANPPVGGCAAGLTSYVNGEALTDPVLWIVNSFHHVPRDEDEPEMPVHWMTLELEPRDWHDVNPLP
ncbi:MAG: copper amine oxidase [Deltaproteobacteria bacterium]|nr:copper amine oxidase [Deltaproteobacteria bacterium]